MGVFYIIYILVSDVAHVFIFTYFLGFYLKIQEVTFGKYFILSKSAAELNVDMCCGTLL